MNFKTVLSALAAACIFWAPTTALADSTAPTSAHERYAQQSSDAGALHQYDSEDSAQQHCPDDEVVWLNTRTGIYHEKGMRWYGNTKSGAYVCRREANHDGDRDTKNGQ